MLTKTFDQITVLLLTLIMLAVGACGYFKPQDHWEPRIGPQEVYTDAPVFRNEPIVSVHPADAPASAMTAMLFPFQVTQPMDKPLILGRALGRVFWQTWNQAQVFPTFLYEDETIWPGLARALALARSKDVDLIVRGEVPYFLSGGSKGTTSLGLSLEIYEVRGGQRIWVMEHSGRMEPRPRRDFIVAHHHRRLPEEPAFSIMTVLACDMANHVGMWNNNWLQSLPCPK
ncbi:MAG TPA: hypothetical protein ENN39_02005 [Desulfonatronum sp.]|nr:hypothetical protein [Desulfonatronum sp.]